MGAICKNTVPKWHGHHEEGSIIKPTPEDFVVVPPRAPVWRRAHWLASVRLLQLVHVLGDFISDWDLVVDALEQMTACIAGIGAGVISSWGNNGHVEPGLPSGNYNGQSIKLVQDRSKLEFPISQTVQPPAPIIDMDAEDHLPSPSEVHHCIYIIYDFRLICILHICDYIIVLDMHIYLCIHLYTK